MSTRNASRLHGSARHSSGNSCEGTSERNRYRPQHRLGRHCGCVDPRSISGCRQTWRLLPRTATTRRLSCQTPITETTSKATYRLRCSHSCGSSFVPFRYLAYVPSRLITSRLSGYKARRPRQTPRKNRCARRSTTPRVRTRSLRRLCPKCGASSSFRLTLRKGVPRK